MPCKKSVATLVLLLLKCKVLTPGQAHFFHKLAKDFLHRAPKLLQNLFSTPLSVHINDLNVTAVDGGLQSLQHVGINSIHKVLGADIR
jgi:hypothetical protein